MAIVIANFSLGEERKQMFYLTTHSTHFIYSYMASAKYHSNNERGNLLPPLHELLRPAVRDLLYALFHIQGSTYHSICYISLPSKRMNPKSKIGVMNLLRRLKCIPPAPQIFKKLGIIPQTTPPPTPRSVTTT